jgi:hypothetical protein
MFLASVSAISLRETCIASHDTKIEEPYGRRDHEIGHSTHGVGKSGPPEGQDDMHNDSRSHQCDYPEKWSPTVIGVVQHTRTPILDIFEAIE